MAWKTTEQKWIGKRVKVMEGAGVASGKEGIVVPKRNVPTDGRGIPKIEGHYDVMKKDELAIVTDSGQLFTMFARYLKVIPYRSSDLK
jgi:hypothetical protein